MPYTTPTTITTGQLVTASLMNNEWIENIKFLANPPACRVYHNANQSIPDNTDTTLAFNSERYDTASMHDNVTNNSRITIPATGLYIVTFHADVAGGTDYVNIHALVRLNGTTTVAVGTKTSTAGSGGSIALVNIATVYKFTAADYIEVRMNQDNSANAARNVLVAANYSPEFSATWIGLG